MVGKTGNELLRHQPAKLRINELSAFLRNWQIINRYSGLRHVMTG